MMKLLPPKNVAINNIHLRTLQAITNTWDNTPLGEPTNVYLMDLADTLFPEPTTPDQEVEDLELLREVVRQLQNTRISVQGDDAHTPLLSAIESEDAAGTSWLILQRPKLEMETTK